MLWPGNSELRSQRRDRCTQRETAARLQLKLRRRQLDTAKLRTQAQIRQLEGQDQDAEQVAEQVQAARDDDRRRRTY